MSTPVLLFVLTLVAYRVTRLLTLDEFPPLVAGREWVATRWGPTSWQSYLSECMWCAGTYVSAVTVAAADLALDQPVPGPGFLFLAVAAGVGLLARLEPDT